ncbi:fungal specific transcription factor [Colletotrichum tofieldiae]|nr:fungal specific transcription factor [Colletotrichum tofieldiae]GKT68366.1 fungal specific transcription factor [Colletotrichum tofieldiae]
MYTYACEYAQVLNLQNLDARDPGISASDAGEAKLDADRKGFWELIQMDTFFRLLFNRPPAITHNMSSWKVNLPWLSGSLPFGPSAVPTVSFLVGSRLTFIVSCFFQELETPGCDEASIRPKTEEKCLEICELLAEYKIEDWIHRLLADGNKGDYWYLGDIAMMAYTYVIFMLHRLAVLGSKAPHPVSSDTEVPDAPLAAEASRRLLRIVHAIMVDNLYAETMCCLLNMYRIYVAYACLMKSILRAADVRAHSDDIELLKMVGDAIVMASGSERDFVPLVRAVQSLNAEVQTRVDEAGAID